MSGKICADCSSLSNGDSFRLESVRRTAPIGLIAIPGAEELTKNIDYYLTKWSNEAFDYGRTIDTFMVECECPRFQSGDAKGFIKRSIRGMDLYLVVDVGNYTRTYKYFGETNKMSPDDYYCDLKRVIQAVSGKAHRINVIMPILYGGRQHRRKFRESLDCAYALQELYNMGVENILTFDAHDPNVMNSVPLMGIDSIIPSYQVLKKLFSTFPDVIEKINSKNFMVISPDMGASDRNEFYASNLHVEMGIFNKRRDYTKIENGRNPIKAHEYLGENVEGKDIFVADDIIASGESVLDIARWLKKRNAGRLFIYATFALFTNGVEEFDKAYEEGLIQGVFGTNLTARRIELKERAWFNEVDVSKYTAYYIEAVNHDESITSMLDPSSKTKALLERLRVTSMN